MNLPRYEYSRSRLQSKIDELGSLTAPFGLVVRYALKANPHPEIISMIADAGIDFDASSSYEADQLLKQGIEGSRISLSSQQSAHNLQKLIDTGVLYVATSMKQLEDYANLKTKPNKLAVRINPGIGSGGTNRTSTGGVNASFGIWHEYIDDILHFCKNNDLKIDRLHIHVGSGADPSVWASVMRTSLEIVEQFDDVTALDIGGGFKVHRFGADKQADMSKIMDVFDNQLKEFEQSHGRQIKLEIEPGTYLVAACGVLVASIDDIVSTGPDGFNFLRLNTGMNDFLRSSMYGSEHEITVMNDSDEMEEYVIVGHNCESGDILTPQRSDAEGIKPRLTKRASIGDEIRIHDTGAYCASMRAKGYNSYPDASEVMVD